MERTCCRASPVPSTSCCSSSFLRSSARFRALWELCSGLPWSDDAATTVGRGAHAVWPGRIGWRYNLASAQNGASMTTQRAISDEELTRLPKDGKKYQLVDGEIRVSPAGLRHEEIVVRLILRLSAFLAARDGGKVYGSSAGYRLPGGNVRSPDVSVVAAGRLPGDRSPVGFGEVAPDVAVEVLSPSDNPRAVLDGVGEYLAAGVRLVWVIDPKQRRAAVHRSLTETHEIGEDGILEGEDVLAGFRCPLAELLE